MTDAPLPADGSCRHFAWDNATRTPSCAVGFDLSERGSWDCCLPGCSMPKCPGGCREEYTAEETRAWTAHKQQQITEQRARERAR